METKKEFYQIMTAHTAAIYHEVLGLDFILSDGRVKAIMKDGKPVPELKRAPVAATT